MGLDQTLVKVRDINLEKFYALKGTAIIAPENPALDQDYINNTAKECKELEDLYAQALSDNDPDAEAYKKRIDDLLAPYAEPIIWNGRKENHIHDWICANADLEDTNLDYVLIDPEKLLSDLKAVLDDHERAPEILPTRSGFFFGGTEYGEYYFDTIERLYNTLLTEKNQGYFEDHSYFYWCWW